MDSIIARLKTARGKLEAAEKEKIVLDTKIEGLMDKLKDMGYKNLKQALKAVEEMESEISNLEDTLGEMIHDFESKYPQLLDKES